MTMVSALSSKRSNKAKKQAELLQRLRSCRHQLQNQKCADCGEENPAWASLLKTPANLSGGYDKKKLGVFCCYKCCSYHFQLGRDVCEVKNIKSAEDWTEEEVKTMEMSGNEITNDVYEGLLNSENESVRPNPEDHGAQAQFVEAKYKQLTFFCKKTYTTQSSWLSTGSKKKKKDKKDKKDKHNNHKMEKAKSFQDLMGLTSEARLLGALEHTSSKHSRSTDGAPHRTYANWSTNDWTDETQQGTTEELPFASPKSTFEFPNDLSGYHGEDLGYGNNNSNSNTHDDDLGYEVPQQLGQGNNDNNNTDDKDVDESLANELVRKQMGYGGGSAGRIVRRGSMGHRDARDHDHEPQQNNSTGSGSNHDGGGRRRGSMGMRRGSLGGQQQDPATGRRGSIGQRRGSVGQRQESTGSVQEPIRRQESSAGGTRRGQRRGSIGRQDSTAGGQGEGTRRRGSVGQRRGSVGQRRGSMGREDSTGGQQGDTSVRRESSNGGTTRRRGSIGQRGDSSNGLVQGQPIGRHESAGSRRRGSLGQRRGSIGREDSTGQSHANGDDHAERRRPGRRGSVGRSSTLDSNASGSSSAHGSQQQTRVRRGSLGRA
ncbi:Stromal membrane-associated protein 2 [Seminavis robusta]|uniref:Stromal membrane-associated protein 2 n=1 Tax=Seminavis robusta TaxID=568900 RepID=A0A9N8EC37_9STRA|nr:Stromal membrane-associated protein 2 [Seminavis robusta]|eukprot:Sro786_g202220.1 Stromal membrane-associated protein 2 (599) ;mRNA; r:7301-9281